jgi:cell division protein FtsQ
MTGIASVSPTKLAQRRRQLQQRRRIRTLRLGWRMMGVCGLAGGVVWAATLPMWVLHSTDQIQVEGNTYISSQSVRSLVPIAFPQSLWRVEPEALAQTVKDKAPIADAKVHRQLVPPGLVVQIQERYPVAIAIPNSPAAQGNSEAARGLLDAAGTWIPLERYTTFDPALKLPTLKVLGNPDQYRPYWSKLYQEVSRSPVKILEIDWRDVNNVVLKTEIGNVRIGPYGGQFDYQLSVLDRMRKLSGRMDFSQVAYINLLNPKIPTVQFGASPAPSPEAAIPDSPPSSPP